ncbi:MAG TPA: FecR domain-containing protein [Lacunisphaera sp.]|nr:FecR domain-containing protein [Lacunisphaera sp.]
MNDADPSPLREQINSLPREIPPARDLWPEIAARLGKAERPDPRALRRENAPKSARSTFRRFRLPLAIAAAVTLAATLHWLRPDQAASWAVDALAGTPRVGRSGIAGTARLGIGEWLETDGSSRAKVEIGAIGEVRIEPNSRLRLINASADNHRLELARGTMSALIWAPPRLFFVETPSATAVDLGCAYTLTVDDQGAGLLEVTAGYVALEHGGRESIIPAGLRCRTRSGAGPGTPFAAKAAPEFRQALDRFDAGDPTALAAVTAAAGESDAITLWHLLARVPATARGAVFDRLASFRPAPNGVTREGIVAGDDTMRLRWAGELGLFAYRLKTRK